MMEPVRPHCDLIISLFLLFLYEKTNAPFFLEVPIASGTWTLTDAKPEFTVTLEPHVLQVKSMIKGPEKPRKMRPLGDITLPLPTLKTPSPGRLNPQGCPPARVSCVPSKGCHRRRGARLCDLFFLPCIDRHLLPPLRPSRWELQELPARESSLCDTQVVADEPLAVTVHCALKQWL